MEDVVKDSRFAHIANDPRFKSIPRSQRRVKIDKRFQSMFNDKRFKLKYTVDKRGRPITKTSNEDLERFYALSSGSSGSESDDEDDDGDDNKSSDDDAPIKKTKTTKTKKSLLKRQNTRDEGDDDEDEDNNDIDDDDDDDEDQSEGSVRSDDEDVTDRVKSKLQDLSVDYARGEGALLSDSSSDEESSDDEKDNTLDHGWGELDRDAERTDEITPRLAVCNMDWDRIRGVDLLVLFKSFAPPGGLVRSVTIYPSEFGLKRLKQEEEQGPSELVGNDSNPSDEDSEENEEGSKYHMEKLRKYQLNRLKYYYAVVVCDSATTANHIYTECDGMEYESSATRLDLRFIPDDTTFDQEPKEICSEVPDSKKYCPRYFTTTALQQAKVDLTWDETDLTRTEIANRIKAGGDVDDHDLQAYLASSSGEEESDTEPKTNGKKAQQVRKGEEKADPSGDENNDDSSSEDQIAKYRSLLAGIEEEEERKKNQGVEMEISWGLGLEEKTKEVVKKRLAAKEERTPFQEMMEKRKEKRKEKKKLRMQQKTTGSDKESGEDSNPYSDDDIPSDIDMNDPYFAEEFENSAESKKSKKKGKKSKMQQNNEETEEDKQKKAELELLLMEDDNQKHFNFKKIQEEQEKHSGKKKNKWKKKKQAKTSATTDDNFEVDVNDKRFTALFSSHHFNIDPTDPHFRKTQGMEALITAKQKRLAEESDQPPAKKSRGNNTTPSERTFKRDKELSLLVKSVKQKTQTMKR